MAAESNAAVSIRGLFKHFDRKIAVNGLALDIRSARSMDL